MNGKKIKGRAGPNENRPRQLQTYASERKNNQGRQVAEATTSTNRAVEGGSDAFSVRKPNTTGKIKAKLRLSIERSKAG
jgi:hypothetical protein